MQTTEFRLHRGHGLVTDVFTSDDVQTLDGYHAIGHTRYSTAGGKTQIEGFQVRYFSCSGGRAFSQHCPLHPFCVKYRMGNLALAHNGNLSNAGELRSFFENQGVLMQSTVDSELFLHLVSHSKRSSQLDQIFDAMSQTEGVSLFIATQRRACLTGLCSGLLGHPHDGQVYGRRP